MNTLKQWLTAASLALCCIGYSTIALADSPVESIMEDMQQQYKLALKASNQKQLTHAIKQLQALTDKALTLHLKNDEKNAIYKDGLHELQTDLEDALTQSSSGQMSMAKDILKKQVDQTKKQYHKDLKVKEDEDSD